jgi:hypothetical protein
MNWAPVDFSNKYVEGLAQRLSWPHNSLQWQSLDQSQCPISDDRFIGAFGVRQNIGVQCDPHLTSSYTFRDPTVFKHRRDLCHLLAVTRHDDASAVLHDSQEFGKSAFGVHSRDFYPQYLDISAKTAIRMRSARSRASPSHPIPAGRETSVTTILINEINNLTPQP